MKHGRSLILATLMLAACSPSQSRQVVGSSPDGNYPARLPLASLALPAESAPVQPEGAVWQAAGDEAQFGVPGQPALLTIACQWEASGLAVLRIERMTRAEEGAQAMFAVIGNGRIARLPLDAVRSGEAGAWRGLIPAADPRLDVLNGGNRIEATLPGGGTLKLPASADPGRTLEACRASSHPAITAG